MTTLPAHALLRIVRHTRRLAVIAFTVFLATVGALNQTHGAAAVFSLELCAASLTATVLLLHLDHQLAPLVATETTGAVEAPTSSTARVTRAA